jgi:hypothetical protein
MAPLFAEGNETVAFYVILRLGATFAHSHTVHRAMKVEQTGWLSRGRLAGQTQPHAHRAGFRQDIKTLISQSSVYEETTSCLR